LLSGRYARISSRALCVCRPVSDLRLKAAQPDAIDPTCGVSGVFASTDSHSEVGYCENQTPYRFIGEAGPVERLPFNQKVGPAFLAPEPSDLRPETTLVDGLMQVRNCLPLDDRHALDEVLAISQGEMA
jgi:hypothetical protein